MHMIVCILYCVSVGLVHAHDCMYIVLCVCRPGTSP